MKYILFLFLCVDGCACSMLGIGPGLISMSPLRSIKRCIGSFLFLVVFSLYILFYEFCICLVVVFFGYWVCYVV